MAMPKENDLEGAQDQGAMLRKTVGDVITAGKDEAEITSVV
jgi:hypothetical protein